MKIFYADAFYAWDDFNQLVYAAIASANVKAVAEIGAGANPLLPREFVRDQGLSYHLVDWSAGELAKAGQGFVTHVLDAQEEIVDFGLRFDLVIARMTLEHIQHPALFFANVRKLLRPGGRACLFFASVTNLPMIVNKLLPDALSDKILLYFQPFRKNENHGKFKAYYRWCFGPTHANIRRFESAGFTVETYTGFFGHTYYRRIPLLHRMEKSKTAFLLKHPSPHLCTYGQVVLCRGTDDASVS